VRENFVGTKVGVSCACGELTFAADKYFILAFQEDSSFVIRSFRHWSVLPSPLVLPSLKMTLMTQWRNDEMTAMT